LREEKLMEDFLDPLIGYWNIGFTTRDSGYYEVSIADDRGVENGFNETLAINLGWWKAQSRFPELTSKHEVVMTSSTYHLIEEV
tara:strand:+ start:114 stop:365 length:252 start_codon:yes stop_codon:yes gene_type:complete